MKVHYIWTSTQARAYLNSCSEATIEILQAIVDRDGGLLMADISRLTGKSKMQRANAKRVLAQQMTL